MTAVKVPPARDTKQPDKDETNSVLFYAGQLLKVSLLDKSPKTHLTLLSNPTERKDIRFFFNDVREQLEDQIVQSFADTAYFLAEPEIIQKYDIQVKIRRRYGFDGHGLKGPSY